MTEIDTLDTQTNGSDLELETKVKQRFARISQSQRSPLLEVNM